jgi:hypothetical protein
MTYCNYYPGICLEDLEKTEKPRSRHLVSMPISEYEPLHHDIQTNGGHHAVIYKSITKNPGAKAM